jgi:hypothetical protein
MPAIPADRSFISTPRDGQAPLERAAAGTTDAAAMRGGGAEMVGAGTCPTVVVGVERTVVENGPELTSLPLLVILVIVPSGPNVNTTEVPCALAPPANIPTTGMHAW